MDSQAIKKAIPGFLVPLARRIKFAATWDSWQTVSWSQEGEDRILSRFFGHKADGFYVDVGAHHPKRFSNTYLFYRRGWRGVNIDAMPGSMAAFRQMRPRDINLECGVGPKDDTLTYHIFTEPALNGFSEQLSQSRHAADTSARLVETRPIRVRPLGDILGEHLAPGRTIDFMSVDVEGLDLEVLRSNDWSLFRPKFILVEVLGSTWETLNSSEVTKFLSDRGYDIVAKCTNTVFFRLRGE